MPPITAVMARTLQITRYRLLSDDYIQLFRGVFLLADEPLTVATWVAAARLVLPADAMVTGLTALQLRGLDLGQPLPVRFAIGRRVKCHRDGISLVQRRIPPTSEGIVSNLDAIAEVCATSALLDAVVTIDRALHLRLITADDLARLREWPLMSVRRAAALARRGAESVRETQVRLCLVCAGLPEPELQVTLELAGQRIGRFDMVLEAYRLIIEYEGDQHRSDKYQWNRDVLRQDKAQNLGYGYLRITSLMFANPWSQVLRVHEALVGRGYQGPAPIRSALWEECFGQPPRPVDRGRWR